MRPVPPDGKTGRVMSAARSPSRKKSFPVSDARRRLLARVHIAKKEMGLTDELYRASVGAVVEGKDSAKDLTMGELNKLLKHFESRGWSPKRKARSKNTPGKKRKGFRTPSSRPMVRKIYVLWSILHKNGVYSAKRPDGFVKRMTKNHTRPDGIANTEWLEDDDAYLVIEALKKIISREGLEGELT